VQLIINVLVNDDCLGSWISRHGRGRREFVCQDPDAQGVRVSRSNDVNL